MIDGVAFHCYAGDSKGFYNTHFIFISLYIFLAPGILAAEFPEKKMFFTECTGYGQDDDQWAPGVLRNGFYFCLFWEHSEFIKFSWKYYIK